ncbi:MAG: SAM-dependent methyltransferase [Gammaproteobacteria bacterium]|nr:SAM-dependent methyltransferase [Gammaproteobacteria bacterium]MDH3465272.1 SAM-dependent methyltransferase [Gammaproteobacteria bacterium]
MPRITSPAAAAHVPPAADRARSERLMQRLRDHIDAQGGCIDFALFMEIALYDSADGYYVCSAEQIGAAGDFVTAPELGDLFAACIARQCAEVLADTPNGRIVEVGAGSGALAATVLARLAADDMLPLSYDIYEISPALRQRQREVLEQRVPAEFSIVRWPDELPVCIDGVVVANEVADALPVTRFRVEQGQIVPIGVTYTDGNFRWREQPDANWIAPSSVQHLLGLGLPNGYESEVAPRVDAWFADLAGRINCGVALIIDYGFPEHEFYHYDRHGGTVMCHYRHRAHSDPLQRPGLQDITAHVNFSSLAHTAETRRLDILGYTQQASFLLALDILRVAESMYRGDPRVDLQITQQIKKLTLPHEMGELFKVLAVGRGVRRPLTGFSMQDHRQRL